MNSKFEYRFIFLQLLVLIFILSSQAIGADYKVLDIYDQGGKKLEPILKKHAQEGWTLKQIIYRSKKGSMMVIFER